MFNFLKNDKGQILALFFQDPEKKYYMREIARILNKEPGYFQAHLNSLVKDGILKDEKKGPLRYFSLNKTHPLYDDIKAIISKTFGIESKLKKIVNEFDKIKCAFIFGSVACNTENSFSDIDLMLVGEADEDLLMALLSGVELDLKREINYQIYSKAEFKQKLKDKNEFITKVLKEPKIILKGDIHDVAGND